MAEWARKTNSREASVTVRRLDPSLEYYGIMGCRERPGGGY